MHKDVFPEVYNHLMKTGKYRRLFDKLDREAIVGIILDGTTWWTEEDTYSVGLTDKQYEYLAVIMDELYGAEHLYDI